MTAELAEWPHIPVDLHRYAIRRAVKDSDLPDTVKQTFRVHAAHGTGQFHNDSTNLHRAERERMARMRGVSERTIQRHYRELEHAGFLVLHRCGHRGVVAEYHYALPSVEVACLSCELSYPVRTANRETLGAEIGRHSVSPIEASNGSPPAWAVVQPDPEPTAPDPIPDPPPSSVLSSPPVEPQTVPSPAPVDGGGVETEPPEGSHYPLSIQLALDRAYEWKESTMPQPLPDPAFDQFWSMYPRHVGKKAAQVAFGKAVRDTSADEILVGLQGQLSALCSKPLKFVPHPTTWLNQGRWDDDVDAIAPTAAVTGRQNHYLEQMAHDASLGLLDSIMGADVQRQVGS